MFGKLHELKKGIITINYSITKSQIHCFETAFPTYLNKKMDFEVKLVQFISIKRMFNQKIQRNPNSKN